MVFLAFLLVYLAVFLEWKMAVAAILAMVHDVVISVGVYSVFQLEVTPETVVAFLTILGYSIYDTIVVFDKVKENQARPALANRLTFTDLTSLSMNQVLMRSINTSIVALLPVISMLVVGAGILGAVTLEQFSIALLVGHALRRLLVDLRRRPASPCSSRSASPATGRCASASSRVA